MRIVASHRWRQAFRGWTAYSLRYKRQRLAVTRWRVGLLRKFLAHMRTKYSRRVGFLRWARNVSAGGVRRLARCMPRCRC